MMNQRAKWNRALAMAMILGLGVVALADAPKDYKCDFENGMNKWRGNGRLKTDEKGNKVCELKKTGKRTSEITRNIQLPGVMVVDIYYKVRAMRGSENVRIRRAVRRTGFSGYSGKEVIADGKWVEHKFGAKGGEGDSKSDRVVAIIFFGGKGVIQIDDIRVVPR
jgi:hypothetical protein